MAQPTETAGRGSPPTGKGPVLALLATAPRPGLSLRGCCPPLTPAEAGALQTAWLKSAAQELPGATVLLYGQPLDALPMLKYFAGPGVELRPHRFLPGVGGQEPIQALAAELFAEGFGPVLVRLCDVPDVLALAYTMGPTGADAAIYVLSGDTGELVATMNGVVDGNINHAFGDIDGDGLPEVVAATPQGNVIAFEHDGALKWTGAKGTWPTYANFGGTVNLGAYCHAFAIYDLDADGSPEILGGFDVFDAQGQMKWSATGGLNDIPGEPFWCPTPTAADLDGDGMLEVIYGHAAYRHDGTLFWQVGGNPGHPHVANLDDDPEPEVLVNTDQGISLINHDGTVKFANLRPTGEGPSARCWGKPGVVHDFNGDGKADLATGTCNNYSVYAVGPTSLMANWNQPVSDFSGLATGTAFDFLGDGVADAIYADETTAYVFEGATGMLELSVPRASGTLVEYPVVADVDNDGSAELVVVSNGVGGTLDTVTVYRDAMDRWTPARRVWNQHAYHVTNVREDGTIPQNMKKSWQLLNTFRTNSQVEAGGNCEPPTPR